MGCMPKISGGEIQYKRKIKPPNPDPKDFKILWIEEVYDYTIVIIHYPNCTTFEGNKLLVYSGNIKKELRMKYSIDPHFTKRGKLLMRLRCDNRANVILKKLFNIEIDFKVIF